MADRDLLSEARDFKAVAAPRGRQASFRREDVSIERMSWRAGTSNPGFSKLETRTGQPPVVKRPRRKNRGRL